MISIERSPSTRNETKANAQLTHCDIIIYSKEIGNIVTFCFSSGRHRDLHIHP